MSNNFVIRKAYKTFCKGIPYASKVCFKYLSGFPSFRWPSSFHLLLESPYFLLSLFFDHNRICFYYVSSLLELIWTLCNLDMYQNGTLCSPVMYQNDPSVKSCTKTNPLPMHQNEPPLKTKIVYQKDSASLFLPIFLFANSQIGPCKLRVGANQQNRLRVCEFANASSIRTHPYSGLFLTLFRCTRTLLYKNSIIFYTSPSLPAISWQTAQSFHAEFATKRGKTKGFFPSKLPATCRIAWKQCGILPSTLVSTFLLHFTQLLHSPCHVMRCGMQATAFGD